MIVDVQFSLQGNLIQADHGFQLFSAISHLVPDLHGDSEVGLHPISGQIAGNRTLAINTHSFLSIRLPSDRISQVLSLAGKVLRLGEHEVHIGVPHTRPLVPSARLYSRLVVIKGFMEPDPFVEAVYRQLDAIGIKGKPYLVRQPHIAQANQNKSTGTHSSYLRRTIQIRGREVVGFALRVEQLTAEESILLQEQGVGGRRRFGCGILIPDRSNTQYIGKAPEGQSPEKFPHN
jgi:CRISPR-associated protein Cas6